MKQKTIKSKYKFDIESGRTIKWIYFDDEEEDEMTGGKDMDISWSEIYDEWIKNGNDLRKDVEQYKKKREEEIKERNSKWIQDRCDCGGYKVYKDFNSAHHSHWCKSQRKATF